jgi:hypothetical protein
MNKIETININPPRAEKRQHADTRHGVTRFDDYA